MSRCLIERSINDAFVAADSEKDPERQRLLRHLATNLEKDCTSETSVLDYSLLEILLILSKRKQNQ